MGRQSLLERNLTSGRVLLSLLQRDDAAKKLEIARKLLSRLYKAKDRKKVHLETLDNMCKRLCSDSCDKTELLEKLNAAREECKEQIQKRVEVQGLLIEEKRKNKNLEDIERRLQQERKLRYKLEQDYGRLLKENIALEEQSSP